MESKTMYLLIVGSRSIANYDQVGPQLDEVLESLNQFDKFVVVSGGADGVDFLAELWAERHGFEKVIFKPDWKLNGRKAGMIRNEEMHKYIAQFPNRMVIAFWDGVSHGTANNFTLATKYQNPLLKYGV